MSQNYAMQCTDVASGQVGTFLFDEAHYAQTGQLKAASPVFRDLYDLVRWDNEQHPGRPLVRHH